MDFIIIPMLPQRQAEHEEVRRLAKVLWPAMKWRNQSLAQAMRLSAAVQPCPAHMCLSEPWFGHPTNGGTGIVSVGASAGLDLEHRP